jgi:hypothetical protein
MDNIANEKVGTGCLEGFRCPKCGNTDGFSIVVETTVKVFANGTDDMEGAEWDADSSCSCLDCHESGIVSDFDATASRPEKTKTEADLFVENVAHLKKWGEPDENGVPFAPSENHVDSHDCLMSLVDKARAITFRNNPTPYDAIARTSLATAAFERYVFGEGVIVEGHDSWDTNDRDDYTKIVYVTFDDSEGGDVSSSKLSFHVTFDVTGAIDEVYALEMKHGNLIGHHG